MCLDKWLPLYNAFGVHGNDVQDIAVSLGL